MNQQFRNITYLSDRGGTGFWRHSMPAMALNCVSQGTGIHADFMQTPILDQNFYKGIQSVTVQRWINDQQEQLFTKFLKPLCDANSAWLLYEIDDAMHYDEIPLFNRGRKAFASDKIQSNIKSMLNTADFVVTTTNYIKQYYIDKYGVSKDKMIALPNLLAKWWFDDKYDVEKSKQDFLKFKAKPRVGIVSSLSHYNVDNIREDANGKAVRLEKQQDGSEKWINQDNVEVKFEDTKQITDDIDEIIETIESTLDDVQWVFFGFCPPKLQKYVASKKIESYGGTAILNYPSMLKKLRLQMIVAPLKRTTFNYCKSPIKFMECAAIGVPLLAMNCHPYSDYMNRNMLFDNAAELKEKLLKMKFSSAGAYVSLIESNYKWLNTPSVDGDFNLKNYWLEDNLNIYVELNRLRKKGVSISFKNFKSQYETRLATEKKNIISNANGAMILK